MDTGKRRCQCCLDCRSDYAATERGFSDSIACVRKGAELSLDFLVFVFHFRPFRGAHLKLRTNWVRDPQLGSRFDSPPVETGFYFLLMVGSKLNCMPRDQQQNAQIKRVNNRFHVSSLSRPRIPIAGTMIEKLCGQSYATDCPPHITKGPAGAGLTNEHRARTKGIAIARAMTKSDQREHNWRHYKLNTPPLHEYILKCAFITSKGDVCKTKHIHLLH